MYRYQIDSLLYISFSFQLACVIAGSQKILVEMQSKVQVINAKPKLLKSLYKGFSLIRVVTFLNAPRKP